LIVGNIVDYDHFINQLVVIYNNVANFLEENGCLTIIVINIKRDHIIYPLEWDLVYELCKPGGSFSYLGNTFWCQDDVGLKPFAVGIHWVSNTLHHFCLHLRKKP
jgi:hypothetical protein